jgi:bacterial/archaeal transporter family-2 protein
MKSPLFYQTLVALAGIALTVQAGINNQLRQSLQNSFLTAIVSFVAGLVGLVVVMFATRNAAVPDGVVVSAITWYKWLGGLLGGFYVASVVMSVAEIGAGTMVALVVAFQLISSVVCDHFGWVGFPVHEAGVMRILGVLLLLAGAYLITKY